MARGAVTGAGRGRFTKHAASATPSRYAVLRRYPATVLGGATLCCAYGMHDVDTGTGHGWGLSAAERQESRTRPALLQEQQSCPGTFALPALSQKYAADSSRTHLSRQSIVT